MIPASLRTLEFDMAHNSKQHYLNHHISPESISFEIWKRQLQPLNLILALHPQPNFDFYLVCLIITITTIALLFGKRKMRKLKHPLTQFSIRLLNITRINSTKVCTIDTIIFIIAIFIHEM